MNFNVSFCRMMTSEMVKAYVNSADRFLSACVSLPPKKIAFCLYIYIIFSSTPCISVYSNNSQLKRLRVSPASFSTSSKTDLLWLEKRSPETGFLICASILLHPGTLQCKQRQFGPFQMSPEASVWPFISKEKHTKKIRSKRPANFSSNHQKKHSLPRVQ